MSDTTSTTSSVSTGTGGTLTSLTGSSTLQLTGLSTGLNTDQIIEELMEAKEVPLTDLQNQSSQLTAQDTELSTLANELDVVANDADALLDPSLYDPTQTVTSSNTSAITATAESGTGAVEGGYSVAVSQLAQSAQRTFSYTPPTSADTITIDGTAVTISAGESASSLAQSINANSNLDVYATATNAGLVLSDRATGQQTGSYIQVNDSGGALSEITADANAGQDAEYTIDNGTQQTSASNTVADAIPGVTLTLNATTTGSGAVTVNVSAPATNSTGIATAVQQFVTDYNSTITDIQTQLATVSADTNGTETGTLYDDSDLTNLLSQMRDMMVQTFGSGGDSALTNMTDLGVSTGATTGNGTISTSALAGDLTLDSSTLESAISSDPNGTQTLLSNWASSFATLVSDTAATGGTISQTITNNSAQISNLGQQITDMQASLNDQEEQLVQQFAALESAESSSSSEENWLTDQEKSLDSDSSS